MSTLVDTRERNAGKGLRGAMTQWGTTGGLSHARAREGGERTRGRWFSMWAGEGAFV